MILVFLPSIKYMTYRLVTVKEFFDDKEFCYLSIFSLAERESVCVGQRVKLTFCFDDGEIKGEERLWVEVTFAEKHYYYGKLLDNSELHPEFKMGKKIEFTADHVIMIW